jgi:hypothetical protein
MAVSPEFRLAAACAMWPPSDRRIDAIRAATSEVLDWPRFLRVARPSGARTGQRWADAGSGGTCQPAIAQEVGAQSAQVATESLAMAIETLRLQRLFDEAPICRSCSSTRLSWLTVPLSERPRFLYPVLRLPLFFSMLIQ